MISIVIVNWNSGEQLKNCISSIKIAREGCTSSLEIVIIDNNSTDGSLSVVGQCDIAFSLILNNENVGFAAACNQGAAVASGDYLLFLNPDTCLFKNSLSVPLNVMAKEENIKIGICGIQLVDETGLVTRTCANFLSPMHLVVRSTGIQKVPWLRRLGVQKSDWDHMSNRIVDHVIGAFFFVRKEVFEELDGFDELFFVYLEDIDFSFRASQMGWRTMYIAEASAFHKGGGSSEQIMVDRLFYSLRSRLLYSFKHFNSFQAWGVLVMTLLIEPITRSIFNFFGSGLRGVLDTWCAYVMLARDIPNIIKVRP